MMLDLLPASQKTVMKNVYPAFVKEDNGSFLIYVPDIDRMTEGSTLFDAISMGRDLIGTYALDSRLPDPSDPELALSITREKADNEELMFSDGILLYIDVDADEYRRRYDNRKVKKNCTIPSWLNEKAEAAGINFSRVLQDALIDKLG